MIALSRTRTLGIAATRHRHPRTLWTSSTVTSSCAESLVRSISRAPPRTAVTVFCVSKHFPQDLLPSLRNRINSLSREGQTIGCVSEVNSNSKNSPPPPFTLSLAHYEPDLEHDERVVTFSTQLQGRPNVSLGREHKPDRSPRRRGSTEYQAMERQRQQVEFEDLQFQRFLSGDKGWSFGDHFDHSDQAAAIVEIPELNQIDRTRVKEIVCFTADRIQPFLSALSHFPNSSTLGMTSTSTPFHSVEHVPFSLFHNDDPVSSVGAVGVAIVRQREEEESSFPSKERVEIDHGDLKRFGPVTTVTASRGNIILTLSNENAAKLLLDQVQKLPRSGSFLGESTDSRSPFFEPGEEEEASLSDPTMKTTRHISKDKEFYAAVFDNRSSSSSLTTTTTRTIDDDEQVEQQLGRAKFVCRIMAGDPKRGAVSFETEEQVQVGDRVVFLHRPTTRSTTTTTTTSRLEKEEDGSVVFSFQTIEPSYVSPISTSSPPSSTTLNRSVKDDNNKKSFTKEDVILSKRQGLFEAFTENGIIVSRRPQQQQQETNDSDSDSDSASSSSSSEERRRYREVRLTKIEGTTVRLFK